MKKQLAKINSTDSMQHGNMASCQGKLRDNFDTHRRRSGRHNDTAMLDKINENKIVKVNSMEESGGMR